MKIGILTLGCDKNLVDTEYLAGILEARGHEIVSEGAQEALDALVIYTCGFIEAARAQTVDAIEAYLDSKRRVGNPRHLVLVGCLTQRYGSELQSELPDVDIIAGVGQPEALADRIEALEKGEDPAGQKADLALPSPATRMDHRLPRKRLDRGPSAYLKIADGCDHLCSFCAIPAMKGPYASVPREIVLQEARELLAGGARELCLIGQDISPYGRDLYSDYGLPELLEDLCRIEGDFWIRLLYFYPAGLSERFLDVFAREGKICKYLDIPLQHLDAGVLRAMRRPGSEQSIWDNLAELRRRAPDVVVRTTMILGFPGESKQGFQNLLNGIKELQFERLGAFTYSPEEGTPAASMPEQVPDKTTERRLDRLMREQAEVSQSLQERQVGRVLRVLVESVSEDGREARGRSYREAPEVDGEIILRLKDGEEARAGDFLEARVTEADVYDLFAELEAPAIDNRR